MAALSVRLPRELDRALSLEAERLHKHRSALVREAVYEYVQRQARRRFMDEMVAEMRDWLGDESARQDSRMLAEALPDDDLNTIITDENEADVDPDNPWWG